jgi:hypothetical protein
MNLKTATVGMCLLAFFLAGCSGALPGQLTVPTEQAIVPSLPVDVASSPIPATPSRTVSASQAPFDFSSCPIDDTGRNLCPPDSPLGKLGCEWITLPEADLCGLDPAYPGAVCWSLGQPGERLSSDEYVFRRGCMLPQYARYVIQRDGQFTLLSNLADLQNAFAPITSAAEALSYAQAATDFQQIISFKAPANYRYFVKEVADSRAIQTDQGYLVNLYNYKFCGCGPHTTFAVDVLIKTDGSIAETGRTPAFEDPEQDTLCID